MQPEPSRSPVALTIAGSDPSGGAGLQADLKTFHQHGVYGMSVVTLLTVQNTIQVSAVECLQPAFVTAQLEAVLADIPPGAAKTGALGNAAIIAAVASRALDFQFPLVVDPVMISKHGQPLIEACAIAAIIRALLPRAFLLTPNIPEAERLTGMEIRDLPTMEAAARRLVAMGASHVLVKGGHLKGESFDLLLYNGHTTILPAQRLETRHTHGTGCVLSAAITARLARGEDLPGAVRRAKVFISRAIANNPGLGQGHGPVNLHTPPDL